MGQTLRKFLYKTGWDTRCRNLDVARLLAGHIRGGEKILDAGCGEHGVAAFISAGRVVGVDILPTDVRTDGFAFVHGSILALPFGDQEFEVGVSVDVLEHLPSGLQTDAINELVRCVSRAVVVTFPAGPLARLIDEEFREQLVKRGADVPDWLAEHLEHPYPESETTADAIVEAASQTGRTVRVSVHYSEAGSVARMLRRLSLRSRYLYLAGNLLSGFLTPVMPKANAENGYRAVILAEFSDD